MGFKIHRWCILLIAAHAFMLTGIAAAQKACVEISAGCYFVEGGGSVSFEGTNIPVQDMSDDLPQPIIPFPPTKVEIELNKDYTMTLNGAFRYGGASMISNLSVSIHSNCYLISIDGGPAKKWENSTMRQFSPNGSSSSAVRMVRFSLPNDGKENNIGEATAGAEPCSCSTGCGSPVTNGGGPQNRSGGSNNISSYPEPPLINPEFEFSSSLGRDSSGKLIGRLVYKQALSDGGLSRQNFEFIKLGNVDPIEDAGGIRQILAPEGLVDVKSLTDGSIEIRFYPPDDELEQPDSNGIYPVEPDAEFVSYRFEAIEDQDEEVNGIIYSVTRDEHTVARTFYGSGDSAGGSTRVVHADGRITEKMTSLIEESDGSWSRIVDTKELDEENGNEVLLSFKREEYASRSWGEVMERSIKDPNGDNLITEYAYYEDVENDGGGYSRIKHVIYPDGRWEKYTYTEGGLQEKTFKPWLDAPADPEDATESNCCYTLKVFDPLGTAVESKEYILGNQVRGQRSVEGSSSEIDGPVTRNLIIEESRIYHGSNEYNYLASSQAYLAISPTAGAGRKGDLYRTVDADLTATRFFEEKGSFVGGVFVASPTGVLTRSITTQGTSTSITGGDHKSTRTISVSGPFGVLYEENQVYTEEFGYQKLDSTAYEYEEGEQKRLVAVYRDGELVRNISYSSSIATTEITEVDETGIAVTSTFDKSGTLIQSSKEGVEVDVGDNHESQLPIVTTYTQSGLLRSTTQTAGTLTLSSSTTDDLMGRLKSSSDEQGRVTTYSYPNGGRDVVETRPGSVTKTTAKYLDGRVKSVTGSGVVPEFHKYEIEDVTHNMVHTVYYGSGNDQTPRWRRTVTNGIGQVLREEVPGPNNNTIATQHIYDFKGHKIKTTRTGLADLIYVFDNISGYLAYQGIDVDSSGSLQLASSDVITKTDRFYEKDGAGNWWEVNTGSQYLKDDDAGDIAQNITKRKLGAGSGAAVKTTEPDGNTVLRETVVDRSDKSATTTITSTLSTVSAAVELQVNGLLVSQSSLTVSSPVLFRYDGLGRLTQTIDPRTGLPATNAYNTLGQLSSSTDEEGNATTFSYYGSSHANAGTLSSQTNQEGEATRYAYDHLGRVAYQWGDSVYPVAYEYNIYGDLSRLRTFRTTGNWQSVELPSLFTTDTAAVTTWGYHLGSGSQISKKDHYNRTVSYTHYDNGLVATRTLARGVVSTYAYDNAGRLTGIDYSDSTPDVTNTYRRDGQKVTNSDASGSHLYTYHEGIGSLATESTTGGVHDGLVLSWSVDELKRANGYSATLNAAPVASVTYGYDVVSRFNTVVAGNKSALYAYTTNSDLLHTTTMKDNGATRLTGVRIYDDADRLDFITWTNSTAATLSGRSYSYDGADRRSRVDLADGSYWEYVYNDRGEVTSGVKKTSAGLIYPGLNHGYGYDGIGNFVSKSVDNEEGGMRSTIFYPTPLNQYDSINTPSSFDVTGSAVSSAIVKVNNQNTQRQGEYFRKELSVINNQTPVWEGVDVQVTLPGAGVGGGDIVTTQSGHRFIAPWPETPLHDEDGNLVSDGRWSYTWDGENRLVAMETQPSAVAVGVFKQRLEFVYDGDGRRVRKRVYHWDVNNSSWMLADEKRFIFDQWNLIAEVDGSGNLINSHVWGLDLSQTVHKAGGVGGLLWSNEHSENVTHFAAHDGNGNVVALADASTGTASAQYDYSGFGDTILVQGVAAADNPFRFSTKYEDVETGLYYYGFRYYDPGKGRWLNRDPIGEEGGLNLYGMVGNNPLNLIDALGQKSELTVSQSGESPITVNVNIDLKIHWGCSPTAEFNVDKQKALIQRAQEVWTFESTKTQSQGMTKPSFIGKIFGGRPQSIEVPEIKFVVKTQISATYEDAGEKKPADTPNTITMDNQNNSGNHPSQVTNTKFMELRIKEPKKLLELTFLHEMGHVIGHRDFYQVNTSDRNAPGFDNWSRQGWDENLMAKFKIDRFDVNWRNAVEILSFQGKKGPWDTYSEPDFKHIDPNGPPKKE